MSNIIFITKDALNKHALPTYGNRYWRTPNIDAIAEKGTIFNRHYTAGGSTAMAFTAMAVQKYCYQTGRRVYNNESSISGNNLFDELDKVGFECHIIWDDTYTDFAKNHFCCEGKNTKIHSLHAIKQYIGYHQKGVFDDMTFNDDETNIAVEKIEAELTSIKNSASRDIFVWMHLPHVIAGRQGYGSDIDVYDRIIGIARSLFGDDGLFVSADHGHMNGWKDKYHYGFDVNEEVACIPLIGPKVNNMDTIDFPTSTIQMYDILYKRKITPLDYVLCETAYYAQPKRKIAIVSGKYKYIFDKEGKKEYLYDLDFDPEENHNLVFPEFYDTDRFLWYSTAQCFYYPFWEDSQKAINKMRQIKAAMWKDGTLFEELYNKLLHRVKCAYTNIKLKHPSDNIKNIGK